MRGCRHDINAWTIAGLVIVILVAAVLQVVAAETPRERRVAVAAASARSPKWPGRLDGRHTYMTCFAPVHWSMNSAVIVGGVTGQWDAQTPAAEAWRDSFATGWDYVHFTDLNTTVWGQIVANMRARPVHPKFIGGYPLNLIHDYGNGVHPRRPPNDAGHLVGRMVYDVLWPDHITFLTPTTQFTNPSYWAAYGDTAVGNWDGNYKYVINWADPEVPALLARAYAGYFALPHAFTPDGIFWDWLDYPTSGTWWLPAGAGYHLDGDRDGLWGNGDPDERLATYTNWGRFAAEMRRLMGKDFIIPFNAGCPWGPLDAAAVLANGSHSISQYSFPIVEHFPFAWGGSGAEGSDYVQKAFLIDGYSEMGFDSYRQWLTGSHDPPRVGNRRTASGGYVILWNKMRANWPYLSFMALFCDGAIAGAGPYWNPGACTDYVDEPKYFTNPMNRLRELGGATAQPSESGGVWSRTFDFGVVKIKFNDNAVLVHRPPGSSGHAANPGGPFQYIAIKNPASALPDTMYRGGGWPRQVKSIFDPLIQGGGGMVVIAEALDAASCSSFAAATVQFTLASATTSRYVACQVSWDNGQTWLACTDATAKSRQAVSVTTPVTHTWRLAFTPGVYGTCASAPARDCILRFTAWSAASGGTQLWDWGMTGHEIDVR